MDDSQEQYKNVFFHSEAEYVEMDMFADDQIVWPEDAEYEEVKQLLEELQM